MSGAGRALETVHNSQYEYPATSSDAMLSKTELVMIMLSGETGTKGTKEAQQNHDYHLL